MRGSHRRRRVLVALCCRVRKGLSEAGLKTVLHANGTNVEGEWDKVFAAVKRCHEVVHEMGAPRISTFVHLGTRTDRNQTMEEKIRSVEGKLAGHWARGDRFGTTKKAGFYPALLTHVLHLRTRKAYHNGVSVHVTSCGDKDGEIR